MCSCRPLSSAELVAAVCQDPDTDETDEIDISMDIVLDACQNLLVVDQELNICRFSHLSVQEYFENHHWSSCEIDCLVGKVCLSLLINNPSTATHAQPLGNGLGENSVCDCLEYVCLNWATHVQRLEENETFEKRLTALLKTFLGSMEQSSLAYQNWHKMVGNYFHNFNPRIVNYYALPLYQDYKRLSPCLRSSLAVVKFGFHKILLDWWTVGFADVNEKISCGDSLLILEAMRVSLSIAADLLKKGADVNASGGRYGSALQAASFSG